MCSMYWTVRANLPCNRPSCDGHIREFQTHDYGEIGDCSNFYEVGELVPNLENVKNGEQLQMIGSCDKRGKCSRHDSEWCCDSTHFIYALGSVWNGAVTTIRLLDENRYPYIESEEK